MDAPENAAVERREASALRYWAQDASQASGMRRSACPGAAIRTAPLGALPPRICEGAENDAKPASTKVAPTCRNGSACCFSL